MRLIFWTIAIAVAVLLVGIFLGVAGIFLAPILGAIGLVAFLVWTLSRAARDKPPIK
jgi:hypothetical protein